MSSKYEKLLLLSEASGRKKEVLYSIPAWDRYAKGVFSKTLSKLRREGKLKNIDVLIVTSKFGIIKPEEKIPYYPGMMTIDRAYTLGSQNLNKLRDFLKSNQYSEIFCCLGKNYYESVRGFEESTNAIITHPQGSGLGGVARDIKQWIVPRVHS